jgi:hypothetical protein
VAFLSTRLEARVGQRTAGRSWRLPRVHLRRGRGRVLCCLAWPTGSTDGAAVPARADVVLVVSLAAPHFRRLTLHRSAALDPTPPPADPAGAVALVA